jgi:hypothetical protein
MPFRVVRFVLLPKYVSQDYAIVFCKFERVTIRIEMEAVESLTHPIPWAVITRKEKL